MIEQIRAKISENAFEFTRHAADQSILRKITISEVREAIQNAEIIEDYPDDKHGPSCLILGYTLDKRHLHIQCSYPARPVG